jgi:D-inositol-3-phosphate glycosyltransferase
MPRPQFFLNFDYAVSPRKPSQESPKGILGWLQRTERRLAEGVLPEPSPPLIRGSKVSQQYIFEALLEEADADLTVLTDPRHSADQISHRSKRSLRDDKLRHRTSLEMHMAGFAEPGPDLWMALDGFTPTALKIRDQISDRFYPTMSIQHGTAAHFLLFKHFARTILTPHYPFDSIVCSSVTAATAVSDIFDHVSESLSKTTGKSIAFNGRIDTVPLGVDVNRYRSLDRSSARKTLEISEQAVVLLYIGYLSEVKADLTPLLSIVASIQKESPERKIILILSGTGPQPYTTRLEKHAQDAGISNAVKIFLNISEDKKDQLLAVADIFVAPCEALEEAFGLSPVEAMAAGIPQVVSDWDGYRDTVIHGETGFLVPTLWAPCDTHLKISGDLLGWSFDHIDQAQTVCFDIHAMKHYLKILITDRNLRERMSEMSRRRAAALYSYKHLAQRYMSLWWELDDSCKTYKDAKEKACIRFDTPQYYRYFGHFATKRLRDSTLLSLAAHPIAVTSLGSLLSAVQSEHAGTPALTPSWLELVCGATAQGQGISVSNVKRILARSGCSEPHATRHILFLIKHGLLLADEIDVGITFEYDFLSEQLPS